jgi:peptidoglycan/LPS O-acetylase OafA/YrhL
VSTTVVKRRDSARRGRFTVVGPLAPVPSRPAGARKAPRADSKAAGRLRALDGYRGLGALMVILIHCVLAGRELFTGTRLDVYHDLDDCLPLFFVLSGMVAYLGIVRGALTERVRGTRELLAGRLWRILPVYYIVVIAVWSMRFAGTLNDWHDLLLHLTFTQVWSSHFIFWLDGPSWFLADDMHFFLVIALLGPLIARAAIRRRRPAAKLAVLASLPIAMLAGGIAYLAYVHYHLHSTATWMTYNPLAKADQFAEGMLLGMVICIPGVVKQRARMASALTVFGLAIVVAIGYLRWHHPWFSTWDFELVGLGFVFMLAGATMVSERQLLNRVLTSRPAQFLALVGFTIFLVQEPVMLQLEQWNLINFGEASSFWLSTVAQILSAAFVAWLAYRFIEQPSYRLRRVFSELRSRQTAGERRRSGPAPRRLPDVVLRHPDGGTVPLREMVGSRPLLVAFGADGERRLAEQRFRLDAGEADALLIAADSDEEREPEIHAHAAASVVFDPDHLLTRAINVQAVLLEVAPDGLITALQEHATVAA